jgi:hypothetical protein
VNAPWFRHLALVATIVAACGAGGTATLPTGSPVASASGSPVASAKPSASAAPQSSPSVVPTASVEASATVASESPEATVVTASEPPETIDGTAGPGCGTGRAGLFAHRDEIPNALQLGGATLEYTSVGVSLRNGTYEASDSVPGGIGLTPDEIAVVVGPGDHILFRAAGLTLTGTSARYVAWSTVRFDNGLASSLAVPITLPWRVRPDGSLSVSAPSKAGDYEVEFGPGWIGTCLAGSGLAYGRIKVR